MTTIISSEPESDLVTEHRFQQALRDYLAAVAAGLGIGLESCTIDQDPPTSAYVALDRTLPTFPDRDLALLWDETNGWSAAIETHSGEDLIVLTYLDTPTVTPAPGTVREFVHQLTQDTRGNTRPDPPRRRRPGNHHELIPHLTTATSEPAGRAA